MKPEVDIEKIRLFVEHQTLDPSLFIETPQCVASYGKFYALLLIRHGSAKLALSDSTRTFVDEFASDASYALYLNVIGAYKPSRLSLRGAIENVLRAILTSSGEEIGSKPIHRLFSDTMSLPELSQCGSILGDVKDHYSLLCKTSHTIDIKFMAHKVPFSDLLKSDGVEFTENLQVYDKTLGSLLGLLSLFFGEAIHKLNVEQQDFVRARLSKKAKKAILDG